MPSTCHICGERRAKLVDNNFLFCITYVLETLDLRGKTNHKSKFQLENSNDSDQFGCSMFYNHYLLVQFFNETMCMRFLLLAQNDIMALCNVHAYIFILF